MDMQSIGEIFAIVFLIGAFSYGWYLNHQVEKKYGTFAEPKTK